MKTIGIYPGTFQPPHKGHYKSYQQLKNVSGPDTFVITTDYDPTLVAPLHFGDKEQILVRHGMDASHIRRVKNINTPWEVLDNFDPLSTTVIYALNAADAKKKVESPSGYYAYLLGVREQLRPYQQRAYIFVVNDNIKEKNSVGNEKIYTSQNVREALGSYRFTDKQKGMWFKKFFGWYDLGLFELLKNKYTNAHQSSDGAEPVDTPSINVKEELQKEICKILNELMGSPPSIATDSSFGPGSIATDTKSSSDQMAANKANKASLIQQKKQAMDDKEKNQTQYKRDKDSVHNYDTYLRKQDDEKIRNINKQITQPVAPTPTTTTSTTT
jgi:hypothetical protein